MVDTQCLDANIAGCTLQMEYSEGQYKQACTNRHLNKRLLHFLYRVLCVHVWVPVQGCKVSIYNSLIAHRNVASIPGRVFAFITVRRTPSDIKAKTRPGIEANRNAYTEMHLS